MVLGTGVAVVMSLASRREESARRLTGVAVGAAALAGVAMLVLGSYDNLRSEIGNTDISKLDLVRQAGRLLPDFGVLGVGRGSFASAFPAVWVGHEYQVATHPENWPAQFAVEWGIPVSAIVVLAIAFALRPRAVLTRTHAPVGAWAALIGAAVHNLVDFNSEVPGVMLVFVTCAGIIVGGSRGDTSSGRLGAWSAQPRATALLILAATAGGLALVAPFIGLEVEHEQRALRDAALDPAVSRDEFHVLARAAMLRHPAEPFLPYTGALRAAIRRDESVLPCAERVLERARVYGRVHVLLARSLAARSTSQARLEYRLAYEQDVALQSIVVKEAPKLVASFEDATELLPQGQRAVPMLESLMASLSTSLPATSVRLREELATRNPRSPAVPTGIVEGALADLRAGDGAPWCSQDRTACIGEALAAADRLRELMPDSCAPVALQSQLLVAAGDAKKAIDTLYVASSRVRDRAACVQRLVSVAKEVGQGGRAETALEGLARLGCATEAECVTNLSSAAQGEEALGNRRMALVYYRRAYAKAPDRDDMLIEVARLASSLGLHAEAFDAYKKLAQKAPADKQWAASAAAEKDALGRAVFGRGLEK
jgi:tetratricopeptide (TPR) repeat protein